MEQREWWVNVCFSETSGRPLYSRAWTLLSVADEALQDWRDEGFKVAYRLHIRLKPKQD